MSLEACGIAGNDPQRCSTTRLEQREFSCILCWMPEHSELSKLTRLGSSWQSSILNHLYLAHPNSHHPCAGSAKTKAWLQLPQQSVWQCPRHGDYHGDYAKEDKHGKGRLHNFKGTNMGRDRGRVWLQAAPISFHSAFQSSMERCLECLASL